jgi:hypothetical protein
LVSTSTLVPLLLGVGSVATEPLGHRGQEAGEHRVGRRVEIEAGRSVGEGVDVLGPPDGAPMNGLDLDQARLAHALEVHPDRVGMEAETLGELGRAEGARRAGEVAIQQVTGLVTERLEDREGIHVGLTVPGTGHIFNRQGFY